jgi:hypothetical protein
MPALSARVIAWARARRDGLLQPANDGRIVARAEPSNVTVWSNDSAIKYSATTTNPDCQGRGLQIRDCVNKWWSRPDVSHDYHVTAGTDASLVFSFQGSAVRLMAHTEPSYAQARIFIDGTDEGVVAFQPPISGTDSNKPLWTSRQLDESIPHKLRMVYEPKLGQDPNGSFFIGIRSFIVETTNPAATKVNANVSPDSELKTQPKDNSETIGIAAGVSGAVALLLVLCAFGFWWYRRRQNGGYLGRPPHSQRIESQIHSNSDFTSSQSVAMDERTRRTISPWQAPSSNSSHSVESTDHSHDPSRGHSASNSLGVSLPGHHRRTSSTTELLPAHQRSPETHSSRLHQSHYAYDADHEPAPVPTAQGLALDILPAPSTSARQHRLGGSARRRDASPTDTTNSYESWTSSDFGPVPEPFVANAPPVPAIPAHLRGQTGRHGPSPLASDEKRRGPPVAFNDSPAANRPGPASSGKRTTLPPRYSAILD